MIPSKMDLMMRFHGGGGGVQKVKPIAPPAPTQAAENLAKNRILDRQRNARGYSSTLIGSLANSGLNQNQTFLKTLLGQ
jgi:hypothetical protein